MKKRSIFFLVLLISQIFMVSGDYINKSCRSVFSVAGFIFCIIADIIFLYVYFMLFILRTLLLSEEHLERAACKVELTAKLVLKESLVRITKVLREVTEECKRRRPCRQLGHVLDLDVFALPCRWRIVLDFRKHLVVQM